MKAKVTKAFPGAPDGQSQVKEFAVGDTVTGDLAAVAVREGWAEEIADQDDSDGKKAKLGRHK